MTVRPDTPDGIPGELADYWWAKLVHTAPMPFTMIAESARWSAVVNAPDLKRLGGACALIPALQLHRVALIADLVDERSRGIVISRRDFVTEEDTWGWLEYGLNDVGQYLAKSYVEWQSHNHTGPFWQLLDAVDREIFTRGWTEMQQAIAAEFMVPALNQDGCTVSIIGLPG